MSLSRLSHVRRMSNVIAIVIGVVTMRCCRSIRIIHIWRKKNKKNRISKLTNNKKRFLCNLHLYRGPNRTKSTIVCHFKMNLMFDVHIRNSIWMDFNQDRSHPTCNSPIKCINKSRDSHWFPPRNIGYFHIALYGYESIGAAPKCSQTPNRLICINCYHQLIDSPRKNQMFFRFMAEEILLSIEKKNKQKPNRCNEAWNGAHLRQQSSNN